MSDFIRYRFKTKAVDDYRPLIDLAIFHMPWWCSGEAGDGSYVIIVCYLPKEEDLYRFWDDAYDIEQEEADIIVYNDRFNKPSYIED